MKQDKPGCLLRLVFISEDYQLYIERLSTLESAELYFRNHHPDLVLLDLEFTNEKTTSIFLL